jgi:hypothetical protein
MIDRDIFRCSTSHCTNKRSLAFDTIFSLCVVLLLFLRWGYTFGIADQYVLAIKGLKMAHPELFARDWFANAVIQPHWLFESITYGAENWGVLAPTYALYWTVSSVLVGLGMLHLSRWLGWEHGAMSFGAIILMTLGPLILMGSATALIGYALPHAAGAGLAILAMAYLVKRYALVVALLTLCCVLVHLQHGANLAVIVLGATIIDNKLSVRQRASLATVAIIALGLVAGIAEWRGLV